MKLKKTICYFLYYFIGIHLPKTNAKITFFSKKIRAMLVKGFANKVGKNVDIQKGAKISTKLEIGNNSGIGINCSLQGTVIIGNDVMMGPEVWVYTRNHKHDSTVIPMREQGFEDEKPVVIGDDVWIGSRVTILPGVNVGRGVIIGSGTIVTKNVPDYAVIVGNPGKIVKYRKEVSQSC